MRAEKLDFENDVASDVRVVGYDAFTERGRYLLFVDMLKMAASDLLESPGGKKQLYEDAYAWARDVDNLKLWVDLIGGSDVNVSAIQHALLTRPGIVAKACEDFMRSAYGNVGDNVVGALMRALNIPDPRSASSIHIDGDEEFLTEGEHN